MTTWTYNTNKTASTWGNSSKTASTWAMSDYETGAPYKYNEASLTYNQVTFSDRAVLYNSLATPPSWVYTNKS